MTTDLGVSGHQMTQTTGRNTGGEKNTTRTVQKKDVALDTDGDI